MSIETEDTLFLQLTAPQAHMVIHGLKQLALEPGLLWEIGLGVEELAEFTDKLEACIDVQEFTQERRGR